jgi:uncharacterized membrane protein
MSPWIWIVAAAVGFVLFALGLKTFVRGGFRRAASSREEDADLPMTPQQKRAWWGLGIGAVMSIALVAVVSAAGPANYSQQPTTRFLTYAIFAAGFISYFVVLRLTQARESEVLADERDRAIMTRALAVALIAGFLTLVVWVVGLTEVYWEAKAVPIDYPTFMLWTTFIAALLGREVGILMGYAGWHGHGES